ncbi:DUF1661 domain-containing protein [Porphyromonas gulae]
MKKSRQNFFVLARELKKSRARAEFFSRHVFRNGKQ